MKSQKRATKEMIQLKATTNQKSAFCSFFVMLFFRVKISIPVTFLPMAGQP